MPGWMKSAPVSVVICKIESSPRAKYFGNDIIVKNYEEKSGNR